MKLGRALAVVLSASFVASTAFAAGSTTDVFDKPLQPILLAHAPKLILYASQKTGDAVSEQGALIRQRLVNIPYITVVHVDLRGIPGFLMGFARHMMQGSQTKANEKNRELAMAAGLKPKDDDEMTHVVMEPDGAPHALIGMEHGFQQAMAIVLDGAGKEMLRVPFPQQAVAVEKALREAWTAEQKPAQ